MTAEPHDKISDENKRVLLEMNVARIEHSAELARAHLAMTRPDVAWSDLTADEQASAIIAAHPWFLAARATYLDGCPRCGAASDAITDLAGGRKECRDCGHHFERQDST